MNFGFNGPDAYVLLSCWQWKHLVFTLSPKLPTLNLYDTLWQEGSAQLAAGRGVLNFNAQTRSDLGQTL